MYHTKARRHEASALFRHPDLIRDQPFLQRRPGRQAPGQARGDDGGVGGEILAVRVVLDLWNKVQCHRSYGNFGSPLVG